MGKPTGFLEYKKDEWESLTPAERLKNYKEFHKNFSVEKLKEQGARCMDCGIPFCHSWGCPLGNLIPDWNDKVYRGQFKDALDLLHYTNNFPEFTGKICPAPCEKACTLSINDSPVSIKLIEHEIIEKAFKEGMVPPLPPVYESGKSAAIIGSGPAGLAAAQQLRRAGHKVTVFEMDEKPGGLLRYGIPDFKLEKHIIDRRINQMEEEGVLFKCGIKAGEDVSVKDLKKDFDAVLIACGSKHPRDLNIPGRELDGVHFAMDFLSQNNRRVDGIKISKDEEITAKGKNVVVIGGGDTGSDCVGTSNRQGAKTILQIELLPKPHEQMDTTNPSWPDWPNILRTSSSHDEGCERKWSISSLEIKGKDKAESIVVEEVEWSKPNPGERPSMTPVPGTKNEIKADLILLAMGFIHVEHGELIDELGTNLDDRGNVIIDKNCMTSVKGIFSAGDSALGASLVVRAIAQGRNAAIGIDKFLMGESNLPDTTLL